MSLLINFKSGSTHYTFYTNRKQAADALRNLRAKGAYFWRTADGWECDSVPYFIA